MMRDLIVKFIQNLHIIVSSEGGRLRVNAHIADFSMEYKGDFTRLLEQKMTDMINTAK